MRTNDIPLSSLHIEKPCSQNWAAMTGDDSRRFCAQCQHHVHNFAELTEREIQKLLATGQRVCGRLERDYFGALKTRPEKTAWLTRKTRTFKLVFSSLVSGLTASSLLAQGSTQPPVEKNAPANTQAEKPSQTATPKPPPPAPQPATSPVVEENSETVELLWMGIVCAKPKPAIKKKYKK